ncbi:hypothetical protein [Arthrobacter sp. UYEF20]|uniref:hypothetical protein n=1 Tax=Arthrobacter sp. UYEF20 TaxID=1756363 RepID=UPI0033942C30
MKLIGIRMAMSIFALSTLLRRPSARAARERRPAQGRDHPERGDVPGWVMITLMSAVLVAALLAIAGPALEGLFNQAMDKVGQ